MYTADVSPIEAYLNELMERRATDLHIAAGSHPMIRIDGSLQPINGSEPLTADETTMIVDRLVGPNDLDRFNEDRQLDFSFPWADRARSSSPEARAATSWQSISARSMSVISVSS